MHGKFGVSIEVKRASRPLMNLKINSNLIGPCDRLLQEDITLLHKISWTFHETSQSNMAINNDCNHNTFKHCYIRNIILTIIIVVVVIVFSSSWGRRIIIFSIIMTISPNHQT